MAEIISYIEDPDEYLKEIGIDRAAKVISYMDSDDAVDVLDDSMIRHRRNLLSSLMRIQATTSG